jgi:hypothetical protein
MTCPYGIPPPLSFLFVLSIFSEIGERPLTHPSQPPPPPNHHQHHQMMTTKHTRADASGLAAAAAAAHIAPAAHCADLFL